MAPEYAATAWEEGFRFLFHAISNYGEDSQAALLLKYMFKLDLAPLSKSSKSHFACERDEDAGGRIFSPASQSGGLRQDN